MLLLHQWIKMAGGIMNPKAVLFVFVFLLVAPAVFAQETPWVSGQICEEVGIAQSRDTSLQPYQVSRILLGSQGNLGTEFSWDLEGEGDQQSAGLVLSPTWLTYPSPNDLSLEINSPDSDAMARLDRAFLKWTSNRWEVTAGLQPFMGGTAYFYQPTRYFNPLPPLAWIADEPLGSEGLSINCFLFDDLSVEGSVRWLANGSEEWTARFINKGIGISITPSFAQLEGKNGTGLEISGTFPDFQVRFEGVNWFFPNNSTQLEWIAGLTTLFQGMQITVEGLQDALGEALGNWTSGNPSAFYLFASAQEDFSGQWHIAPALVKSVNGGPLLLWPKVSWSLNLSWKLMAQAQWPLGSDAGPLGLLPGRSGVSLAYAF